MKSSQRWTLPVVIAVAGACGACGDDASDTPGDVCEIAGLEDGDPIGHAAPLGAAMGEARAGRLSATDLPEDPSRLLTWAAGDFVLANHRVALVIEDAGASDLYDPWGGRPVGLARVVAGDLVEPAPFGELFLLSGRSSVMTQAVTVLNDGSNGEPAVVRARGSLAPTPFFESVVGGIYPDAFLDIEVAIDYSLAPDADHVDITLTYASPRTTAAGFSTLHAAMFAKRMPVFQPGIGFSETITASRYMAFTVEGATSWAYIPGSGALETSIATGGFIGAFGTPLEIAPCTNTSRLHAKLVIGGPGTDGVVAAAAGVLGEDLRVVTGTVRRGATVVNNFTVHATDATTGTYLSRTRVSVNGNFALHVPLAADVILEAIKPGEPIGRTEVGMEPGPVSIEVPRISGIRVMVSDGVEAIPARIQVLPVGGTIVDAIPANYGEPQLPGNRLLVTYAVLGEATVTVPPGTWEVIASRGYEYEIGRMTVTVAAGDLAQAPMVLEHAVPTPDVQCADFHIHTARSSDSGDDAVEKVRQALAEGLELPVRSDHEWVADFSAEIAQLQAEDFAAGFGSVELTSFEVWGHMGVFPLVPDPSARNAGAPAWQVFPTPETPEVPLETLPPLRVFDLVRARPEQPVMIINHPRGGANYFDFVGFDPATGLVEFESDWDTKFTLVEVFNDAGWIANRDSNVADWLGLLKAGRTIFAVGSSDSHALSTSPVGYPRTCLAVGTDDPRELTGAGVRDVLAAGHSTISGGIYVSAAIGTAGPGDTTPGAGDPLEVTVTVRAASWIDVDAIEVVVDGETVDTIPIMPGDADPEEPTLRWSGTIAVQTAATGGFVVIAAYGDSPLEPVHPGRIPFGVTNPIFVAP